MFFHSLPTDKFRKFLLEQENTSAEKVIASARKYFGRRKKNNLSQEETESSRNCPSHAASHNSQGYDIIQIRLLREHVL